MKEITGKSFDEERAFYGCDGIRLTSCAIDGPLDGESAFKEGKRIWVKDSLLNLRYPFWHDKGVKIEGCDMTENCRAALWYSTDITVQNTKMHGIKALRECRRADVSDCDILSPEFGWFSRDVSIRGGKAESEYFLLKAKNIRLEGVDFTGKYSFQYVTEGYLNGCRLSTKDAFWHSKNVTVENCMVNGEYLGWYSQNLTFINCDISGTQPLCYCKGLRLINCRMTNADLCFEKSDVQAEITTPLISIKNAYSGRITAPAAGEIIKDDPRAKAEIILG